MLYEPKPLPGSQINRADYIIKGQGPIPVYAHHLAVLEERIAALEAKIETLTSGRAKRA
jgi:hypothetical protein